MFFFRSNISRQDAEVPLPVPPAGPPACGSQYGSVLWGNGWGRGDGVKNHCLLGPTSATARAGLAFCCS